MTLLKIYDLETDFSKEFEAFLKDVKPWIDAYDQASFTARKARMMIIGTFVKASRQHKQRSPEFRKFRQLLNTQGWNQDIIDSNARAFKQYNHMRENVNPEFQALAEAASVTALAELQKHHGQNQVCYEAAMHLKRTKKVPTKEQIRGRVAGFLDDRFQSRFENRSRPVLEQFSTEAPTAIKQESRITPEHMRAGITSEHELEHIERLIANESLPFITSISEAMAWWKFACHRDLLLTIVKQKISVAGLDSELAEQLRELLTPTDDASSEWLVEQEE